MRVPTPARHTAEATLAACPSSVVPDTIMRTIEWAVTITNAAIDDDATTIFCTAVARDPRCPDWTRPRDRERPVHTGGGPHRTP
jgi:hypothetical protein